jgi:hypothetical protein
MTDIIKEVIDSRVSYYSGSFYYTKDFWKRDFHKEKRRTHILKKKLNPDFSICKDCEGSGLVCFVTRFESLQIKDQYMVRICKSCKGLGLLSWIDRIIRGEKNVDNK